MSNGKDSKEKSYEIEIGNEIEKMLKCKIFDNKKYLIRHCPEYEPDGTLRGVVLQYPGYLHIADSAYGVVMSAGGIYPTLRILMRDEDYDLIGARRSQLFCIEIVCGIPRVFRRRHRELATYRL